MAISDAAPSQNLKTPLLSVIMSVYSSPEHIPEAIESILNQSFQEFEFIIINDHSPYPECGEILNRYAVQDNRIRIITLKENKKLAAGRNIGLRETKGRYIALMDSDDICERERFKSQLDLLTANPEIAACSTPLKEISADGKVIIRDGATSELTIYPRARYPEDLPGNNCSAALMIRREIIETLGGWREWFQVGGEEVDLWRRLHERFVTAKLAQSMYHYRQRADSQTSNSLAGLYAAASLVSAIFRRLGLPDPVEQPGTDTWDLIDYISVIPPFWYLSTSINNIINWIEDLPKSGDRDKSKKYVERLNAALLRGPQWPIVEAQRKGQKIPPSAIRVSVLMHVPENADANRLSTSLDSVLKQTLEDFELIVCDCSSTYHRSYSTLREYAAQDQRIKILRQAHSITKPQGWNLALEKVQGEFTALMDCGAIASPGRLQTQYSLMKANPELAGSYLARNLISPEKSTPPLDENSHRIHQGAEIDAYATIAPTSMFAKTETIRDLGGWRLWFAEGSDYDLTVRLGERHPLALDTRQLYAESEKSADQQYNYLVTKTASEISACCRQLGIPDSIQAALRLPDSLLQLHLMTPERIESFFQAGNEIVYSALRSGNHREAWWRFRKYKILLRSAKHSNGVRRYCMKHKIRLYWALIWHRLLPSVS